MRRPHARRSAFTLLELLVVIAILAMLIGILVPSLSGARRQAKANACLSALKQLGSAFAIYLTENRDVFPPFRLKYLRPDQQAKFYVNEYNAQQPRWQWFLKLDSGPVIEPNPRLANLTDGWGDQSLGGGPEDRREETMSNQAFRCPVLDDPRYEMDIRDGAFGYNYQYLGNSRQDSGDKKRWDNFPVRLHQITTPGSTVLIADSRGGGNKKHGIHSYTLDPPRRAYEKNAITFGPTAQNIADAQLNPDPLLAFSPMEPRHNNQGNVIFADTHGEAKTLVDLGYELRPEDKLPIPVHDPEDPPYSRWDNRLWTGIGRDQEVEKRPAPPEGDGS